MENTWYRFPITVVSQQDYELYGNQPPADASMRSYVDFRLDSIVGLRAYFEDDGTVTGTQIYTTAGTDFAVDLKPSEVRKILGYTPINKEEHGN